MAGATASGIEVFSGVVGAPAHVSPAQASCGGPYTTVATSPVTREEPYLYMDPNGHYNVCALGAAQLCGHDMGWWRNTWFVHANQEFLHCSANGLGGDDQ